MNLFVLSLPEDAGFSQPQAAVLNESLRALFQSPKRKQANTLIEEDFELLSTKDAALKTAIAVKNVPRTPFPILGQIPRPEDLFSSKLPYHLIVMARTRSVIIQGSHQQSLELISAYFKKWARDLKNDTRKVRLLNSKHDNAST